MNLIYQALYLKDSHILSENGTPPIFREVSATDFKIVLPNRSVLLQDETLPSTNFIYAVGPVLYQDQFTRFLKIFLIQVPRVISLRKATPSSHCHDDSGEHRNDPHEPVLSAENARKWGGEEKPIEI